MVTTAPAPAPARERAGRRRRHPVRWILALLAVVLVAAYVALPHLTALRSVGAAEFSDDATVSLPRYGERGTYVLAYEHGADLSLRATVANRGPLPVTVSDVRLTDEPRPLVKTTSVLAAGAELPIRLWPGQSATIDLDARFGNCRYYHEREMDFMGGLVVDGSVAGRDFSSTVPLDQDLLVHSPMLVGCPDRTIDRGDDSRR